MTARVDITTSEKQDALAVPIAALKTNDSGSYVLRVKDDGTTEQVPVKTGIYSSDYVEILSGLTEAIRFPFLHGQASRLRLPRRAAAVKGRRPCKGGLGYESHH